jgi:hypothetical protein
LHDDIQAVFPALARLADAGPCPEGGKMSNSHGQPRRFGAGKVLISLVAAETAAGPYLAEHG